ncbi:MAG: glycosyltransferase family 4 protein, partial [Deltaproteobacteria bacterium]|nr:glycosyltransferase family 4 protein [Deltaproteobacteria bacterium]
PVVLYADEITYAAGADLLVDALKTVCRRHQCAQFVIAGDGPLKNDLEAGARQAGIDHRCRFTGDISSDTFDSFMLAADFVVIPSRVRKNETLARHSIANGRPVLTTHQSGIGCVVHGQNGLLTFDNPGSITWGIQELLGNPLPGMLRRAARQQTGAAAGHDAIAARHVTCYDSFLTQAARD